MKPIARIAAIAMLSAFSGMALADTISDAGAIPDYGTDRSDDDWSGMVGLALLSAPEYQGGDDTESNAAPVVIVDYQDTFYFKVNRGGYWFWKPDDSLRVGALLKIRSGAWEEDDDEIEDLGPIPSGFDEPDSQAEVGVNLQYKMGMATFEVQATSGEDLNIAGTLDYRFLQSEKSTLTGRIGFESLGEDTVKYNWYGDSSAFSVDSAFNTSLALIGTYMLNPEWSLIYGAQTTSFDDEIDDSPIVSEDTYTIAFFGATWLF
jgi:outer membrane scaffolding protein for murein synthesis (MipA/OmpV family)